VATPPTIVEAMERIGRELQEQAGDKPILRSEIVRRVVAVTGCTEASVIPSDHCYNRTNKGIRPHHVPLFLHVGRGQYRFVGRDQAYVGSVVRHPKGGRPARNTL
jgi:hypothetical protein